MILREGEVSSTFKKTIYFDSNLRTIDAKNVTVGRKSNNSYAFNLTIDLLIGEIITFHATWTAKGHAAGSYNLNILSFSDDPDVDPKFRACQDASEVQIVRDSPIISELMISPVYHPSGLDPQETYVYPEQDIQVRCNVTCLIGIENVTLYYSVESREVWKQSTMTRNSENEWIGTILGQSEGKQIVLYVEAFGSTGKSSRTREYTCRVSDLRAVESMAKIATVTTVTIILVACTVIFALKKRRMTKRMNRRLCFLVLAIIGAVLLALAIYYKQIMQILAYI